MLDLCPCIILICGCTSRIQRLKKPPPELQRIMDLTSTFYCINCRCVREAACYRYRNWYTFFCIPIFPYHRGHAFLGCVYCRNPVQPGSASNLCGGCGSWVEMRQRFCPQCGELNRAEGNYNREAVRRQSSA